MIKERRNPRKFGALYSPNAMENSWVFNKERSGLWSLEVVVRVVVDNSDHQNLISIKHLKNSNGERQDLVFPLGGFEKLIYYLLILF